ncbi:MAG: hypothetical protein ABI721_05510 [Candidatus Dojkabacteria bacterium]
MADATKTTENIAIDDDQLEIMDLRDTPNQKPASTVDEFVEIQKKDYSWKVDARKPYGLALVILLFIQNALVFAILIIALFTDKLAALQVIFSVIIPATLVETAYMVKVIIEWLFKDINYPPKPIKN